MNFFFSLALYPFWAFFSLLFTMFAMLGVNWWAPLFADAQGNLPRWLKWFQPFDSTLNEAWQGGYLDATWGASPFKRYLARVYWLYRNPVYSFNYRLFGVPFHAQEWRVMTHIQLPHLELFIAIGNGFNVYYHGRLGTLKLGWKAWNRWDGKDWKTPDWNLFPRLPFCCSFSPFKRRITSQEK